MLLGSAAAFLKMWRGLSGHAFGSPEVMEKATPLLVSLVAGTVGLFLAVLGVAWIVMRRYRSKAELHGREPHG